MCGSKPSRRSPSPTKLRCASGRGLTTCAMASINRTCPFCKAPNGHQLQGPAGQRLQRTFRKFRWVYATMYYFDLAPLFGRHPTIKLASAKLANRHSKGGSCDFFTQRQGFRAIKLFWPMDRETVWNTGYGTCQHRNRCGIRSKMRMNMIYTSLLTSARAAFI